MTTLDIFKLLLPILSPILMFIVGAYVFKNDQKNKNIAIETRFETMSKDIKHNHVRIREDLEKQTESSDKMFARLEDDLSLLQRKQVEDNVSLTVTKTTLDHLQTTMNNMSEKLDVLVNKLVNKEDR